MAQFTVELSARAEVRTVITIDAADEATAVRDAISSCNKCAGEAWEILPSGWVDQVELFNVDPDEDES